MYICITIEIDNLYMRNEWLFSNKKFHAWKWAEISRYVTIVRNQFLSYFDMWVAICKVKETTILFRYEYELRNMHTHLVYCKELNYYRNFTRDSLPKAKVIYHFNKQIYERKTKFRVLTNDDIQQRELGRSYLYFAKIQYYTKSM